MNLSSQIEIDLSQKIAKRIQFAFIGIRTFGTPCWSLLSMMAFILYKNMHLTPLQIAVIIALKPTASLLSPYWNQAIYQRPDKIVAHLTKANFLRHLPFLFFPWIESSWFMIAAFGMYMTLTRTAIPAWLEMFKHHLPKMKCEQMVGYGTTIDYLGTAVCSIGIGFLLDRYQESWKWLFSITAGCGIVSTLLLLCIPHSRPTQLPVKEHVKIKETLFRPWKQVWQLISQRKDFAIFQIGFMFGGAGLMIMQPALPPFFVDRLHLSFVEMGLAISLCKGLGVALASPFWIKIFRKIPIFQLNALVTFFAMLFPFLLLATSFHWSLLYLAYALYGIMQAGSELSWHMSGIVFSQEKDSSPFSTTNVLTVGLRGCLIPAIGSLLLPAIEPLGVLLLGACLCLVASGYFLFHHRSLMEQTMKSQKTSKFLI